MEHEATALDKSGLVQIQSLDTLAEIRQTQGLVQEQQVVVQEEPDPSGVAVGAFDISHESDLLAVQQIHLVGFLQKQIFFCHSFTTSLWNNSMISHKKILSR